MNRESGSINIIVIIIIGSLLAVGLYWFRPTPNTRPLALPKPPVVSVVAITPQTQQLHVQTQGVVASSRDVNLVAEVAGRVVSVHESFVNGGFVSKDDVMVTLDSRDYEYRLINAGAEVAVAQRELALERGQARQAKREWRDLGSDEANALSLRVPQVRAAQAQLRSAIAQRDQAKLNVERASIRAPFSRGRVQETNVNVGQYVSAGTVIANISDSALAEVRLPLTDKQLALIGLPLGVNLSVDQQKDVVLSAVVGGKEYQWPAKITRTEASIDSTTRFYFAVAQVPEPYNTQRYASPLVTGLFVNAKVTGVQLDDVITVPELALIKNSVVYIVDDNNRLQQRVVNRLATNGNMLWVSGDLKQGEYLVVSDPKVLQNNLVVTKKIIDIKQ